MGHPLLAKREERRTIVVVITSDKGLCGAFNANLLAEAAQFCKERSRTSELQLVLIGKKAAMFFKKYTYPVMRAYTDDTQSLTRKDLEELAGMLIREFFFVRADAVYVVYNEFRSILAPHIIHYQLMPVEIPKKGSSGEEMPFGLAPDWEPDGKLLMEDLLHRYIKNEITHFFSESIAAEHAARMMAMDNATKNAEDLIEDLTLELNKIRQASITKELLEIMTAVDALAK